MINKQVMELGDWLNRAILDCVLWLDKNQDMSEDKIVWYIGYKAALETILEKLEQISSLTGAKKQFTPAPPIDEHDQKLLDEDKF